MLKEVFDKKSKEMGDFYVNYNKQGRVVFAICTSELDNKYIQQGFKRRRPPAHNKDTQVLMWNWRYDQYLIVSLSDIKSLTPLSAAVSRARGFNGRQIKR